MPFSPLIRGEIQKGGLAFTTGTSRLLPLLVPTADLCAGKRTTQHYADVTNVKCSGAQGENTPHHGQYAEHVVPKYKTDYQESCAGDQTKDAARRTVEEF